MAPGPPYAPQTASLGGQPTIHLDVPITAVFLFLFMVGLYPFLFAFHKDILLISQIKNS